MFGVTLKEVQSYVDKKLSKGLHVCLSKTADPKQVNSLHSRVDKLTNRLAMLEEYLKVEYKEESVRGYVKIKKSKK